MRFGRLALVLAALTLPLLILELTLRTVGAVLPGNYVIGRSLERHPVYGVFHPPNSVGWYHTSEYVNRFAFSSVGLRGPDIPYEKPSGTFRVLMLGDSYADSLQVPLEQRFSELIESRFAAQHAAPAVQVINAGVENWSSVQELLYFENEGFRYQPDLVVLLVYPFNDIEANGPSGMKRYPRYKLKAKGPAWLPPELPTQRTSDLLFDQVYRASWLFDVMYWGVVRKFMAVDGDGRRVGSQVSARLCRSGKRIEESWIITRHVLETLRDRVRSSGSSFAIVVVPAIWQVHEQEWLGFLRQSGCLNPGSDINLPNRILSGLGRELGVSVLDPTAAFQGQVAQTRERLYFPIDNHWTPAGHVAIAARIYDLIRESLPGR